MSSAKHLLGKSGPKARVFTIKQVPYGLAHVRTGMRTGWDSAALVTSISLHLSRKYNFATLVKTISHIGTSISTHTPKLDKDDFRNLHLVTSEQLNAPLINGLRKLKLDILQLRDNGKRHHVMKKLLVALRYLANGSFQLISGDALECSQEYVSRSVAEVVEAIIENRDRFIRFPPDEAITRGDAEVDPRLPRCIGLIDGTHILLKDVVPMDQRADFVDSKKNVSLNVQAVLGANNLWVSVNSSNPGSVHDSRVYQSSRLFLRMRYTPAGYWLCGDSAYGLSPSLLTPYNDPIPGTAEAAFNVAHKSVRSAVERGFRKLKRSWAICNGNLRLTPPSKAAKAVLACFCLHNFQKMMGEPEVDLDDEVLMPEDARGIDHGAEAMAGIECRRAYTIEFFA